jgi:hypothetical protein
MSRTITFLFYHYGKIPKYLRNAIEHVRIFNPEATIKLITDDVRDISVLRPFGIQHHNMSDFPSDELETFRHTYQHVSCFDERYERFVLDRWFVSETIRRSQPDQIYIMQDSDVAVFGDASKLLPSLPDCPIALSGNNPHFTFVRHSLSSFLQFILDAYADRAGMASRLKNHEDARNSAQIYNFGEMQFLYEFMNASADMQKFSTDTPVGYVDVNIHIPEDFDFMQLRRRPRKKVLWKEEEGLSIPYFLKGGSPKRAFLIHFQGPGKRVFFRFNRSNFAPNSFRLAVLNTVFQNRFLANLT